MKNKEELTYEEKIEFWKAQEKHIGTDEMNLALNKLKFVNDKEVAQK